MAQSSTLSPSQLQSSLQCETEETTRTERFAAFSRLLPSQEALGEGGELAFPVLDEVTLGHEVVELLPLLWHHHPRILLHAEPQTCAAKGCKKPVNIVALFIFALFWTRFDIKVSKRISSTCACSLQQGQWLTLWRVYLVHKLSKWVK